MQGSKGHSLPGEVKGQGWSEKQASKRHSLPGEVRGQGWSGYKKKIGYLQPGGRGQDWSGYGKKVSQQGALTS